MNTISFLLLSITILLAIVLIIIFTTGKIGPPAAVRTSFALGTIISLKAFGNNAELALEEAIGSLNDIDDKMSAFKDYSEISKINKNAGVGGQKVSDDTFKILKESVKYSEMLEGTFDPTIRPLVSLWNIGTSQECIPGEMEVEEKRKLVNYKDIIFDENNKIVMLKQTGQALDVGGIAKGYAADIIKEIFIKHDIKSGLIDLGGNIYGLGGKEDGSQWNVGIQDPSKPRGEFIGILSVQNKSVVTSGNYEKYFLENGKVFHHIIDPKTGYPSDSNIISATIISDKSIDGDGLSTGVYILGVEKSMSLIESLEGVDAIFITDDKSVYITSGIKDNFKLTNNSLSLQIREKVLS